MIQTRPIWSGQAWESFSDGAKVSHFFLSNHPVKKKPLGTLGVTSAQSSMQCLESEPVPLPSLPPKGAGAKGCPYYAWCSVLRFWREQQAISKCQAELERGWGREKESSLPRVAGSQLSVFKLLFQTN